MALGEERAVSMMPSEINRLFEEIGALRAFNQEAGKQRQEIVGCLLRIETRLVKLEMQHLTFSVSRKVSWKWIASIGTGATVLTNLVISLIKAYLERKT